LEGNLLQQSRYGVDFQKEWGSQVWWHMNIIPPTCKVVIERLAEVKKGKNIVRPCFTKQAGCGGICL
jgi:hypothetical protein